MFTFDWLEYHGSKAELTPDLITLIHHFPVIQTLSWVPVVWTLIIANDFNNFADCILLLVCTLGTDGALSLC